MGPRGIKCAFVSYTSKSKAYRLLNLESNVIIESRDVEFFEHFLTSEKRVHSSSSEVILRETSQKVDEQPSSQDVYEQPNE